VQIITITKNTTEGLKLIVGGMGFVLIHEIYPDGVTHVTTLNPREARALCGSLQKELPGIEKRSGVGV
jgi:hypothetical protein